LLESIPGSTAVDLERIADALGPTPPVTLAAAHVYPAAAPAFEREPFAARERPSSDRLRLYVHVPFCNYKCSFCYYATRAGDDAATQERYVAALERELEWIEPGSPLGQIFVGGGTPTAIPAELLARILSAIFARVTRSADDVHTVEASPESIDEAHVRVLREHGIGRVSMGVQSLDDGVLGRIHRRHSLAQVLDACDLVVRSGLILNVDLMYGLPGQDEQSFARDLELVTSRGIHSVTLYDLRVTRRTSLGRQLQEDERLEDVGRLLRWRWFVAQRAAQLGFSQTRWHTFKRLDTIATRHERAPCFDAEMRGFQLGVGMSARSHLGYTVYRNHDRLHEYVARIEAGASPVEGVFRLDAEGRSTQFIARTLGDGKPLDRGAYARAFGCSLDRIYGEVLTRLLGAGLVSESDGMLELTPNGRLVYDRVMLSFYPKRALDWLWAQA
jgi:oxygen-independent coproporphyrinogen-3 oxidase